MLKRFNLYFSISTLFFIGSCSPELEPPVIQSGDTDFTRFIVIGDGYLSGYQDGALFKDAPRSSWFALGAGSSVTWVDPKLELVCIMRWIDAPKTNDCIAHIMRAL